MDIRTSFATQGYGQARQAAAPQPQSQSTGDNAFAKAAGDFASTLRNGENTAKSAMTGGADPQALVEALSQTQLAVETAVTVRDRIVEAYQEILRMPV